MLKNETNKDSIDENPRSNKIHKPPPVIVCGVLTYRELIKRVAHID